MLLLLPDLERIPLHFFTESGLSHDEAVRLKEASRGLVESQFHFFYGIVDVFEDSIVGVIWMSYNPIHLYINLHVIYLDKAYQDGKNVERFTQFVKEGLACMQAKRIVTYTKHYRISERKGWKVAEKNRLVYHPLDEKEE